jgi:hypothetical protein
MTDETRNNLDILLQTRENIGYISCLKDLKNYTESKLNQIKTSVKTANDLEKENLKIKLESLLELSLFLNRLADSKHTNLN